MRTGNERTCMISDSDENECEMVDEEYEDDLRSEGIGGDFQELDEALPIHENLREDIKQAAALYPNCEEELGTPAAQIQDSQKCLKDVTAVRLTFSLNDIPEHLQQLWNLDHCVALEMDVDNVHRAQFRAHESTLAVSVKEKCGTGSTICAYQLSNLASKLIAESYKLSTNESPSTAGSFFAKLYSAIKERLPRMSEYCIACGEKLETPGVLPSICEGALCNYQSSNFGFFYCLDLPRVSPEVLSLLLHAFGAANISYRREDIMTPLPPLRNFERLLQLVENQRAEGIAHVHQNQVEMYTSILQSLQCPKQIMASEDSYEEFKRKCPVVAEFLAWLVVSNQSYLERVPPSMKVDFLLTNYQYLFVSDTPSKQEQFDKLVQENGGKTRFFFHGSPIENWHSIIRSGLKKLSGTKLMMKGAAYGAGIYLTPSLKFALRYARGYSISNMMPYSRRDCLRNKCCELESESGFACVALVEVVDSAEAYSEKTYKIFVSDEQWCSIRMLLLYRKEDIEKLNDAEKKFYDEEQAKRVEVAAAAAAAAAANRAQKWEHAEAPDALLNELSQQQPPTESAAVAAAATSQPAAAAATSQPAAAAATSQPAAAAATSQPAAAAATAATSQPAAAAANSQPAVTSQSAADAEAVQHDASAATVQPAAAADAADQIKEEESAGREERACVAREKSLESKEKEQDDTAGPSRRETNDKRSLEGAGENQESKKFKKDEEESPSPAAAVPYVWNSTIAYPRSSLQAGRLWRRLHGFSRNVSTLERQIPGELTVITDEQREQINRVVRMFRNGGMNGEIAEQRDNE